MPYTKCKKQNKIIFHLSSKKACSIYLIKKIAKIWICNLVQVNLCQKLLFLHQLTYTMTTNCSLNYKFNTYMKNPSSKLGITCWVEKLFLTFRTIFVHIMISPCSAKRRASDKDLSVIGCWDRWAKKKIIKFDNEKALDLLSNKVNCGKNWVISRRMTGIRVLVSVKFTKVGESIWKCQIILLEIVIPPPFYP